MTDSRRKHALSTRAIHAGHEPDPVTGAVMPSISVSSTFRQEAPGKYKKYDYARAGNPSREAFETCIADLEGGRAAFAFASGMAAEGTVLELLDAGSHIVAVDDLYGGTYRLFENVRKRSMNLSVTYVDPRDTGAIAAAIRPETRMIWVETPTNPLLKLADLEAIGALAKDRGVLAVCDSTFATPMLQRPLEFDFDIVLHSVTKYINGHSDMVGGVAVVGDSAEVAEKLAFLQKSVGAVMDPFSAFLALRGVKTLSLRMARHSATALHVARMLEAHPKVRRVYHPFLESHPQYDLAQRQMSAGSGIVSAELAAGRAGVERFVAALEVITLAESLGGVESLVNHPASMTHASIPAERRREIGISDGLIRLSIGLEDADDLEQDLDRALAVL